jgi:hypothetical protein
LYGKYPIRLKRRVKMDTKEEKNYQVRLIEAGMRVAVFSQLTLAQANELSEKFWENKLFRLADASVTIEKVG